MNEFEDIKDSRSALLLSMADYGFGICPFVQVPAGASAEEIEKQIQTLKDLAEIKVCHADFDITHRRDGSAV